MLKNELKTFDWVNSSLHTMFEKNGRFKDPDPEIYSEIEIEYYISMLKKLANKDDLTKEEQIKMV
jgi:hypothetical protein